jgi:hypothetical protein
MSEATTKAALMTEHRDYIDGYAAGLADGRRIAPQPSSDAIREHLEGVARRSCTDEQFNAFKWIIDATFESLDLLHATQQATPEPLTGCNCRWQGDTQVEWCELHLAHKDAIHDWAGRAKSAEQKLAMRPAVEPMTPLHLASVYAVIDSMGWDLDDQEKDDMVDLVRATEKRHGITAKAEDAHQPTKEPSK